LRIKGPALPWRNHLVAPGACSALAGALQPTAHTIPPLGMGPDAQTGAGAVALDTGIARGMAGLAGGQILPGLDGMTACPTICGDNDGVILSPVAGSALGFIKCFVNLRGVTVEDNREITPAAPVGFQGQLVAVKIVVTVPAEAFFRMAAAAQPGIGAGGQRVSDVKIRCMDVVQVAAERSEFTVLAGRGMALVACRRLRIPALPGLVNVVLVAVHAISDVAFGVSAVVQSPSRVVGFFAGIGYPVYEAFFVAVQAGPGRRCDPLQIFPVAEVAGETQDLGVQVMVECNGLILCNSYGQPCQNHTCNEHEYDAPQLFHG